MYNSFHDCADTTRTLVADREEERKAGFQFLAERAGRVDTKVDTCEKNLCQSGYRALSGP